MQKHPGTKEDQGFLLVPRLKREGRRGEGKEAAADVELMAEAAPQELGPPSQSPQPAAPTGRELGAPLPPANCPPTRSQSRCSLLGHEEWGEGP